VSPDWRVSSPFGWRQHPTLKKRRFHEGIDLATPVGTPVQAAGSGTVTRARADSVNGKYVKLSHGHGVTSAYCHGDAFRVSKGQSVQRGDHVMDSGNTGRSSGPHLHFGLRIDGHSVDPALLRASAWTPPEVVPEKVHEAAHEAKPEPAAPSPEPEAPSPEIHEPSPEVPEPGAEPPDVEVPSAEPQSAEVPSTEVPSTEVPSAESPSTEPPSPEVPIPELPSAEAPAPAPAPELPSPEQPSAESESEGT
jgi:hypothetical protein